MEYLHSVLYRTAQILEFTALHPADIPAVASAPGHRRHFLDAADLDSRSLGGGIYADNRPYKRTAGTPEAPQFILRVRHIRGATPQLRPRLSRWPV